MAQHNLVCRHL